MSLEDLEQKRELVRQRKLKEASENAAATNTGQERTPESEKTENVPIEEESQEFVFLAFARIFSGTLRKGQELFILSPKHNPEDFLDKQIDLVSDSECIQQVSKHVQKVTVSDLFLMMGRELDSVDEVPCGNIVAIGGLDKHCLKSATLASTAFCPSFSDMHVQTTPIMRVAIEPKHPSKIKDLARGLKLLNQADPCVEIVVQENGEHILCTAGEVHLQRCVEDLVNLFAKCEVNVSQPLIPFKETIVKPVKSNESTSNVKQDGNTSNQNTISNNPTTSPTTSTSIVQITVGAEGRVELTTSEKRAVRIVVRARPLPLGVTQYLEENSAVLKLLTKLNQNKLSVGAKDTSELLKIFKNDLEAKFVEAAANDEFYAAREWKNVVSRIISFGPNRYGPNMLINMDDELGISSLWSILESSSAELRSSEYESNIIFGFNLATAKGPICEEPMQGVAFFVDKFQVTETAVSSDTTDLEANMADMELNESPSVAEKRPVTGTSKSSNFISLVKDVCRRAFEAQPQRLMAAMYKCEAMTVSSEALGKLYAVLGKRFSSLFYSINIYSSSFTEQKK